MDIPDDYIELDLYEVLQASKELDQGGIRKAYLRRALKTHPDKTGGDDTEFRKVSFAYSILSDERRRKQYDETGQLDFRKDAAIADLFSKMVRVEITEDMIEEDKKAYQGSEEEKEDVLNLYRKYKGDFNLIFEGVMHATDDDQTRLIEIINEALKTKTVPTYGKFKATTGSSQIKKRSAHAKKEAEEVEEDRKKLGLDTEDGLKALIQKRQADRGSFGGLIDKLEAKYSVKKGQGPAKRRKRTKT